jgi:hypothetical protein
MEIWKDIPEYEGLYKVSNLGNVRSLPRATTKGGLLKQQVNSRNGYCYVCLSCNGKIALKRVHILVAEAFFGVRKNGVQVNHLDGDKTNNNIANLEYCTQSENMKHAYATGLQKPRGLAVIDLDTMNIFVSATEAGRSVSSTKGCGEMVARVCRGERSHYKNHRFAFYDDYLNHCIPRFKGKHKKKASETLWR